MKLSRFRCFVTNKYYENRDEYDSMGQAQPYTDLKHYVTHNLQMLKTLFKQLPKEKL